MDNENYAGDDEDEEEIIPVEGEEEEQQQHFSLKNTPLTSQNHDPTSLAS